MDTSTFFICVALNRASHPSIHGVVSKVLLVPESMWMIDGYWDDVVAVTDSIKSWDSKRVDTRFIVVPKIESEFDVGSCNFIALYPMARECGYLQMTVPNDVEPSELFLRSFMPRGASLNIEKLSIPAAGEISSSKNIEEFFTFAFQSARALMSKNELSREVQSPCDVLKRPEIRL